MKNFIKLGLLSLILTGCTFVIEPEESEEEYAVYHLVEFDSVYGNKVESQNVKHGEKVTKPEDPVGEGYIFVEWQYNNKASLFDEGVVTKDITLTVKWDRGEFYLRLINSDPTKGTIKASGFREKVKLSIAADNSGTNINTKVRLAVALTGELAPALEVKVTSGETYDELTNDFNSEVVWRVNLTINVVAGPISI